MPETVSSYFKLNKTQAQLDFANVLIFKDTPLFIDPLPLSQRTDSFSEDCHLTLKVYFQNLVDCIRNGKDSDARALLQYLREPNETRLGFSQENPQGAGIGGMQAEQIFQALKNSTAVKTGFISSLAECELMVEGIGSDKISDLTTNVIRGHLIEYTQGQCNLHNIPVQSVPMPPIFNPSAMQWESDYRLLPVVKGKPLLLVPKSFVKISCAIHHYKYYRGYVLEYMQEIALAGGAHANLVKTLVNQKQVVYKNRLEEKAPCSKDFLYEFSKKHSKVLEKYRGDLIKVSAEDKKSDLDIENEIEVAKLLITAIKSVPRGAQHASDYHNLMIGIVEFIFFPQLDNPIKEQEINEGRKRIDIVMDNAARQGIFSFLHLKMNVPSRKVPFECKNYVTEVSNPEIDQLAGRLSLNRGMFGVLCCRHFENRGRFIARCKDSWRQQKQLMIPLDDATVIALLDIISEGKRETVIDKRIQGLIEEVWE